MKDEEKEQFIKDKSAVNQSFMKEVGFLVEKLEQTGEKEIIGYAKGWTYTFKREVEKTAQDLT